MGRPYREANEERRWIMTWKVIGGVVVFFFLAQLVPVVLLAPAGIRQLWERATNKPCFLEQTVSVDSPNGHNRLRITREGRVTLMEVGTSHEQLVMQLDTREYVRARVRWKDIERVQIAAEFRAPFLKQGTMFVWNITTRKFQEE